MPMYLIVCESVLSYALDRSLRAGYAAAGSAVRHLDVRRSSVSLVPGVAASVFWQTIKNNRT